MQLHQHTACLPHCCRGSIAFWRDSDSIAHDWCYTVTMPASVHVLPQHLKDFASLLWKFSLSFSAERSGMNRRILCDSCTPKFWSGTKQASFKMYIPIKEHTILGRNYVFWPSPAIPHDFFLLLFTAVMPSMGNENWINAGSYMDKRVCGAGSAEFFPGEFFASTSQMWGIPMKNFSCLAIIAGLAE